MENVIQTSDDEQAKNVGKIPGSTIGKIKRKETGQMNA